MARNDDFNFAKAELYEALGHPTRILILQALGERQMSFSELKRRANIESSGNLSFHLNKLSDLIKTAEDGTYTLTDEGREAVRIVEATELVTARTQRTRGNHSRGRTLMRIVLISLVILGVSILLVSSFLGSVMENQPSWRYHSPPNFVLSPGAQKFLMGIGLPGNGPWHIVYDVYTGSTSMGLEFQINEVGTVNRTVLSVQDVDYVDTFVTIGNGNDNFNFTISNRSPYNITIVDAFIAFEYVIYPYQGLANLLFYLGVAVVAVDGGLALWWLGRSRRFKRLGFLQDTHSFT